MLQLKASHKQQRSVIRFLWANELSANTIHSEMHSVQCASIKITSYGLSLISPQWIALESKTFVDLLG